MGDLSEKERNVLEALSSGIVNKILHQPTVVLKQEADSSDIHNYLEAARKLFNLNDKCQSSNDK